MGRKVRTSWLAALRRAEAFTALLSWLELWLLSLVNINCITRIAWKARQSSGLRCSLCCTDARRGRTVSGGFYIQAGCLRTGRGKGGGHRQRPADEGPGQRAESLRPAEELDPDILNWKRDARISLQFLPEQPGIYKSVQVAPHAELRSQVRSFRIISKWLI